MNFNDLFKSNNAKAQGSAYSLTAKQKIILSALAAAAVIVILILCIRTCSSGGGTRGNTISLVKMYMERGEYDRALDKIDELMIKDKDDKEVLALLNQVLEAKKNSQLQSANSTGGGSANVTVEVDTNGITNAVQSSIDSLMAKSSKDAEENRKAMEALIKKQQEQAAIEEAAREERKANAAAIEEKRKKEEAQRKAAEEELAKKNAKLKQEIVAINDEIQQGASSLNSGNILNAVKHFEKADKLLPVSQGEPAFSVGKYSQMAGMLYDSAQNSSDEESKKLLMKKAVEYAEKALAKDSKDANSLYILAMNSLDDKDNQKALDYLTKAVSYDGKNYIYYYNLGRVQFMMKKFTEAKYSFTTTGQLNPSFAPAFYNLGLTNQRLNDKKSALASYRKAHDIDSRYERAYLAEARVLNELGDSAGAISAYQSVLRLNSTNRDALGELGSVYYKANKLQEAESSFRRSISMLKSGENDSITFYNLSTVLYEQNKINEALSYAVKAYDGQSELKNTAARVNVIYNYALILEKSGKLNEAVVKYGEVLSLNPKHLNTLINLGVIYMGMNPPETQKAMTLFSQAVVQEPGNFEANNNLGSVYLAQKDYKAAINSLQTALSIDSKSVEARENLAQAFAGDGQYDNAKTTYNDILRIDDKNWNVYVELGKVCMALNDNASAQKYFMLVQAKQPEFRKVEVASLLASINDVSGSEAK